ncbi:proline synthase co-transcribed bacterialprotein-like [Tropilaelaps mercedesae]|uniref:Proline synthase co-transcribed bacterialprotein-like n=1 Tax=Tropilaelaps mercedesae TaxID=418985 RepID=A0A1V9X833_9ACAR|nr:proline synthase co-transcribed bacterialprotein-like [Tropilaelaps mercedesae]
MATAASELFWKLDISPSGRGSLREGRVLAETSNPFGDLGGLERNAEGQNISINHVGFGLATGACATLIGPCGRDAQQKKAHEKYTGIQFALAGRGEALDNETKTGDEVIYAGRAHRSPPPSVRTRRVCAGWKTSAMRSIVYMVGSMSQIAADHKSTMHAITNHVSYSWRPAEQMEVATSERQWPPFLKEAQSPRKGRLLEAVLAAYAAGARHFGENYVQELVSKAGDASVLEKCPDLKWHYIAPYNHPPESEAFGSFRPFGVETTSWRNALLANGGVFVNRRVHRTRGKEPQSLIVTFDVAHGPTSAVYSLDKGRNARSSWYHDGEINGTVRAHYGSDRRFRTPRPPHREAQEKFPPLLTAFVVHVLQLRSMNMAAFVVGRLQSKNVRNLLKAHGLWAVETVTSTKLADLLNSAWESIKQDEPSIKLNVMVQVNTSGEEQKGGVEVSEVVEIARHIKEKCARLSLLGLMTIGFAGVPSGTENPDFACLLKCRNLVAEALGVSSDALELSMGMSADFEQAIAQGSTNVRVGSTIFETSQPRESRLAQTPDGLTFGRSRILSLSSCHGRCRLEWCRCIHCYTRMLSTVASACSKRLPEKKVFACSPTRAFEGKDARNRSTDVPSSPSISLNVVECGGSMLRSSVPVISIAGHLRCEQWTSASPPICQRKLCRSHPFCMTSQLPAARAGGNSARPFQLIGHISPYERTPFLSGSPSTCRTARKESSSFQ